LGAESIAHVLRAEIDAWSSSPGPWPRTLARVLKALGYVRRFLRNPRIRSEQLTRLLNRDAHYQGATATEHDRYPELFRACQRHLQNTPSPSILSFGCSTGEEVFSLAEYLPHAKIVGVDINRWCLQQCAKKNRNPRVRFLHSLSPEYAALGGFDAIFCMAIFQRTENRTRPTEVAHGNFNFEKFEEEIRALDKRLKAGGLLFIDHADFRFEDTDVAARFTPLEFDGNLFTHDRPVFDRDNRLIATQYSVHRAFRKQSASAER